VRYPVISLEKATAFYVGPAVGQAPDPSSLVSWVGNGDVLDVDAIASSVMEDWNAIWAEVDAEDLDETSKRQKAESLASASMHSSLAGIPTGVLDDPDFWRFLGLVPFRPLVLHLDGRPDGTIQKTGREDVPGLTDHVVRRMFLRGQMHFREGETDPYESLAVFGLAGLEAHGRWRERDLTKSHLVRIKIGQTPTLARAFLGRASDPYMSRDPVRLYVKVVTRARRDVAVELYGESDADEFARDQRDIYEALSSD
jgi:hypothetical protein